MAKLKVKLAPKPPPPDVEFFYDDDVPQRSPKWFALRLGVPTASKFSCVMAQGRDGGESMSREKYMQILAGEIVWGRTAETFQSEAMARGVEMEPLARDHYFESRFDEPRLVGFVRRRLPSGRFVGCSPDCQVGDKPKGLEIKTVRPEEMVALLQRPGGGFPARFRAQLQGTMLVTGWLEMALILYYEGADALEFTATRDDAYIQDLSNALEVFDHDLNQLVADTRARLKSKGTVK
jgi:YqaJ-like recombinase protein